MKPVPKHFTATSGNTCAWYLQRKKSRPEIVKAWRVRPSVKDESELQTHILRETVLKK